MKKLIISIILSIITLNSFGQKYFNIYNNRNVSFSLGFSAVRPDNHTVSNGLSTRTIDAALDVSIDMSI